MTSPGSVALAVVRRIALRRRRAEVERRGRLYASIPEREIVPYQDALFRAVWERSLAEQPFYRLWARQHGLPERVDGISDLAVFPPLTKQVLREHQDLVFARGSNKRVYSTAGSTGAPVLYPRGRGEALERYAAAYVSRSWWGIEAGDPYVHVWGASHQFGGGLRAAVRVQRRQAYDAVLGAVRLNAYDMTPEKVAEHARTIWRTDPCFIAGYASSVLRIARHAKRAGQDPAVLTNLRAVLVTSENITEVDRRLLVEAFDCPVINEYGSAETGAIAASAGATWPLRVLWDSIAVTPAPGETVHVTTLHPRVFPLINYQLGDVAKDLVVDRGSVLHIGSVEGRAQDELRLRRADGGVLVANIVFPAHVLKALPSISAVQIWREHEHVTFCLTADEPLALDRVKQHFLAETERDGNALDPAYLEMVQIPHPVLTRAGKQPLMLLEPPPEVQVRRAEGTS